MNVSNEVDYKIAKDQDLAEEITHVGVKKYVIDLKTFRGMDDRLYYGGTIIIYVLEVIGGIFINDLGSVFGYIGAFSMTYVSFALPSVMFILADREERKR